MCNSKVVDLDSTKGKSDLYPLLFFQFNGEKGLKKSLFITLF